MKGIYYVKVNATANSYYSIYYYTQNEFGDKIYLPPGEVQMEIISNFTQTQGFIFKNRNVNFGSAYFITTLALNCELKFTIFGKEYSTRENTFKISKDQEGYDTGMYELQLVLLSTTQELMRISHV